MDKRLLLASPHMSDEGYELKYIHDAFQKNWIAPVGDDLFARGVCLPSDTKMSMDDVDRVCEAIRGMF